MQMTMGMTDIGSFVRVSVRTKGGSMIHLDLVCDSERFGLWKLFKSTEALKEYIDNNTEEAFSKAVQPVGDSEYVLNCQTADARLIVCGEEWEKAQGQKIKLFLPIIQSFLIKPPMGGGGS